eukprot:scaffold803_cov310-Pinguiococcus_pyrenoidosus.AAC.23
MASTWITRCAASMGSTSGGSDIASAEGFAMVALLAPKSQVRLLVTEFPRNSMDSEARSAALPVNFGFKWKPFESSYGPDKREELIILRTGT